MRFFLPANSAACQIRFLRDANGKESLLHRLRRTASKELLETTIQAPTSFNIQHWRFVILRDPELRAKIRKDFGNDQAQMTDASLLVLFTADMKAWQKEPSRYFANAAKEVAEMLVNWMGPFHEGR